MAASYWKTLVLESLFNSEYYEIFKSTYFEEHLQTLTSENVFMRIIHKEIWLSIKETTVFSTSISETSENVCFYFMIGFPWSLYSFTCNISLAWWEINSTKYLLQLIKRGSKVQETWEHALNFDQWKTFSEN